MLSFKTRIYIQFTRIRKPTVNALTINPETKKVDTLDIEMKANTIYSFFNSILIDELSSLNQHTIYCDANALSEHKKAYFLGEQLLVGDALIVGLNGMEEVDAIITKEELEELIEYEVNPFYSDTLLLLADHGEVNLYRSFHVSHGDQEIPLSIEWVLYTFNMADEKTKNYFITELMKAIDNGEDVVEFMKKMAGLALSAAE